MLFSTATVVYFGCQLMEQAQGAKIQLPSLLPLSLAVVAFSVVTGLLALAQSIRVSHRFMGPVRRIVSSMAKARGGDIGFRLHLRRGDCLTEVATEFNRLLDYLNENPPAGAKAGSDVVELEETQSAVPVVVEQSVGQVTE